MHIYIQTVTQYRNHNKTQPEFHALDVLASERRIHVLQTTLKIMVSCSDAYPLTPVALRVKVVSCSTHQQLFKQQLAPWSEASEVSTSTPSFRVEFLGPNNTTNQREDSRNFSVRSKEGGCRTWSCCRWYSAQVTHKIQGTVESRFVCKVPQDRDTFQKENC